LEILENQDIQQVEYISLLCQWKSRNSSTATLSPTKLLYPPCTQGRPHPQGVLVADGNGLNQLNQPHFVYVDQEDTLYVSDWSNHRVMKWMKGAKEGVIVAGGQGQGSSLKQLSYPQGIFVDKSGSLYVADSANDRIVRWVKNGEEGSIIAGGNNIGSQPNQLNRPIGLLIDNENSLYIADYYNNRIQKFIVDK